MRSARVALVLPEEWAELDNPARMRLLQRQAQVQRCDLALVTRSDAAIKAARTLGIPTFHRPEEAANRDWKMHPALPFVNPLRPGATMPEAPPWNRAEVVKQETQPSRHRVRQERIKDEATAQRMLPGWMQWASIALVGVLCIGLLGLFALYVLPAATVTVHPGREKISVTTRLVANPDLDASDLETNQIKGRLVETIIEESGAAVTSGSLQRPTIRATGQAVFSNLGAAPVLVPLGTVVSTGTGAPVSFRTVSQSEIPGGVGQRVFVPIEAVQPGVEGNVRSNTITNIDGPLRFRARVSNPNGTGGGGSELVRAVTQQDKDKLLAETLERAKSRAVEALSGRLDEGEWLPPEAVETYVVAQAFDQYNDDAADQVNLTLRVLAQGVAINEDETRSVLQSALQTQIPVRGKLVADSLTTQRLPGATPIGRGVEFTVTVNAEYVTPVEPAEVRSAVAGRTVEDAAAEMQRRWLLEAPPEFYADPDWLGLLPVLPSRIQVRIVYDEPTSANQGQ
jgi:hypothetical protein